VVKRVVGAVVLLALVAAGIAVIRRKEQNLALAEPPALLAVPVHVAVVRDGAVEGRIATAALVQSETVATLSAQVAGALLDVRFREGDSIRKGDILARVDPRVLDDAVVAAEARTVAAHEELAKQQAIFERDTVLFQNDAIARQALDVSRAQFEAARAAGVGAERGLGSARILRSYADVAAPYSGIVTARLAEPGDLAAPGRPLFTIQVPGPVRLISKLSQESLARLAVGDAVTLESAGQTLAATISRIYPALDAAHLGTVQTDLAAAPFGLSPGAAVSAAYATHARRGVTVPVAALLRGTDETLVIRVRGGKADPVPVTVAGDNGIEAVVSGGVAAGDTVAVGLPSELMALTAGTLLSPQAR
jgi:RND family efflux transporter MFP subunit